MQNWQRFSPILWFAFLCNCLLCCTEGLQFYEALFVNCWPYSLSSQIPVSKVWSCASLLQCVSYSFFYHYAAFWFLHSKTLVHLELIYKVGDEDLAEFSYMLTHPSFPASFVKEVVFSLVSPSAIFVKNQVTRIVWTWSGSSVLLHWSTCLFMTVPCRFYYHGSVVYLKVG